MCLSVCIGILLVGILIHCDSKLDETELGNVGVSGCSSLGGLIFFPPSNPGNLFLRCPNFIFPAKNPPRLTFFMCFIYFSNFSIFFLRTAPPAPHQIHRYDRKLGGFEGEEGAKKTYEIERRLLGY